MKIRDRIVGLERVPASSLIPNPKNWRRHPKAQADALRGVLAEIGWAEALIARRLEDGTLMLIDGHLRAETTPTETVPVLVLDVNEAEADTLLVTLDPLAAMAEGDGDALRELLAQVDTKNDDVRAMLDALAKEHDAEPTKKPMDDPGPRLDEAGALREKWGVERGQIWTLGKHRLLCGDSTSTDDVRRLMNGERASWCWADPPWNVAYGENKNPTGWRKEQRAIVNDNLGEKFPAFVRDFVVQMKAALAPGAMVYLVMSAQEWPVIDDLMRLGGFHWSSTIIWKKDRLVLSRKDYHTQYEPIWYGWEDSAPRICPLVDRTQTDVWEIDRPSKSDEHPTMKPIELVARSLTNSSSPGSLGFEPFSGSGSTIIAAEQTGRRVNALEIEPKYVAVALQRWADATGETPVLA